MRRTAHRDGRTLRWKADRQLNIISATFARQLRAWGYGQPTVRAYQAVAEMFLRTWLGRGRRLWALNEACLARFIRGWAATVRRRRWPTYRVGVARHALQRLLGVLRQEHRASP